MLLVYSKDKCSKCIELKKFLLEKDIKFKEFDITHPCKERSFILNGGFDTVPQVFRDSGEYVGDCDGTIMRLNQTLG